MKKDMTTGKEWKLILLFTLPIMAGNLLQQLYNTIDGIIVGNFVSEDAFAAVGTCQPLTFLFLAFAMGLSVGVGIVVSQFFGAGRHDELSVSIDTALVVLGICGLIFTVIGLILTPFLLRDVLIVPDEYFPLAVTYFRIYCLGLFFQFLYNGIAATLRGLGDSKATLYFLLITTVLNTALDLLFVILFRWSVAGAAVATVISQVVCAGISYLYLRRRFPFVKSSAHFNRRTGVLMIKLGLPLAVQQSIVAFGNGSMQRLVNGFASTAPGVVAAFAAGNRLDSFLFVPIMGFQSGLANFTGQNIGAGRLDRVKRGYIMTLIMSMSITVAICILLYTFAQPTIAFFSLKGNSLRIGTEQIRYLSHFFWMFSGYITLTGLLQGAGDTIIQSIATLSALAVRILTGYLAVHFGLLGYSAAWVTTPIGWCFAIAITYTRFFSGAWKKKAVAGSLTRDADAQTQGG